MEAKEPATITELSTCANNKLSNNDKEKDDDNSKQNITLPNDYNE